MSFPSLDECLYRLFELGDIETESSQEEREQILLMIRYHAHTDALKSPCARSAADTITLLQEVLKMAASLGDPEGIEPLASAQLEMLQRAILNENGVKFHAAIRAYTAIAASVAPSARIVVLLRGTLNNLEECARVKASCKLAFAEIAEVESLPQEQRDEKMRELDRRLWWEERSRRNCAAIGAPQRAGFLRRRRSTRRAPRVGARRCSARRATCDAGRASASDGPGDGDGPSFRGSLLRAYGVAPVREPGRPRGQTSTARSGESAACFGLGVACGRGPYPSAARACAALWRRRFQGPPRGPVRAADGGGQHGCEA